MPVTIKPSPQSEGFNVDPSVDSTQALLREASKAWGGLRERHYPDPESRPILRSSFDDLATRNSSVIVPYGNGFVTGIIRAFQQDLHLVLRPDDAWLCILTQFSMYVNANAEELRSLFVSHKGKKELVVDARPEPVAYLDCGKMSQHMADLISDHVVDPKLKDWIMPRFTTTTHNDKSIAAVVMMGTLKRYFDYAFRGGCGFPSVTLLGEPSDWEEILRRVEELPRYGKEAKEWSKLLVPIIKRFIATFFIPESQELKDFWLRACHSIGKDGSGDIETYSGWLTAFCFWNDDNDKIKRVRSFSNSLHGTDRKQLVLDGVAYPIIRPNATPDGVVFVPVKLQDFASGIQYQTTMIAGLVGMEGVRTDGRLTTVQPSSGWWMLQDSKSSM
ncbi:uncharacterized protein BDZ99DRAFT_482218 [Mytilinidion resinicola]|uniref:DUF4419 domain-containing protein n=1 Tax=Mytilinidion resinicola TaxID=574789 RepID=A0A6A6Y428_9PEZI|nr:uncharacterized protein BDZ99DRAFT_482218 [Mytilinidion resinicola]KAF2803379.1 hypothetical protein BDZ99DRAFT_482218 [Mytilinidion resinicola]